MPLSIKKIPIRNITVLMCNEENILQEAILTKPPFRAEHVGSLLRPVSLKQAYQDFAKGRISLDEFRAAQDKAIIESIKTQESMGFKAVTDGEFRRSSYWGHLVGPISGIGTMKAIYSFRNDFGERQPFIAPQVIAKIARKESFSSKEFTFTSAVASTTPKITMPSLPTFHFWRGYRGISQDVYPNVKAFFSDLSAIFRQELEDLTALGATYIQMDDVPLAMLCDPDIRDQVIASGDDPDVLATLYIDAINEALNQRPKQLTAALHLCRGNFKGKYLSQGSYIPLADRLFNEINVDAFFLEYDTQRAGDFTPLRFTPPNTKIILGLVSTKRRELENISDLTQRIDAAASFVPLENLAISPQCGFASAVSGNPITEEDEKKKLQLVVDTAITVWGTT